jgi:hypothetical protein
VIDVRGGNLRTFQALSVGKNRNQSLDAFVYASQQKYNGPFAKPGWKPHWKIRENLVILTRMHLIVLSAGLNSCGPVNEMA